MNAVLLRQLNQERVPGSDWILFGLLLIRFNSDIRSPDRVCIVLFRHHHDKNNHFESGTPCNVWPVGGIGHAVFLVQGK